MENDCPIKIASDFAKKHDLNETAELYLQKQILDIIETDETNK